MKSERLTGWPRNAHLKLLIAGIIPGLLVMLTIIGTVVVLVWLDPARAPVSCSYSIREKLESLSVVGPMLLLFVAVTGSIYLGVATRPRRRASARSWPCSSPSGRGGCRSPRSHTR